MSEAFDALQKTVAEACALIDRLQAENKQLRADNERLREGALWKPIETAPKDGREILVFLDGDGEDFSRSSLRKAVACWYGFTAVVFWKNGGFSEFSWDRLIHRPTHWMPLPPPPQAAGEGKQ